ncbi:MAG: hypothetical protein ACE5EZ_03130 [Thermodesulfobacteriota bacterium]
MEKKTSGGDKGRKTLLKVVAALFLLFLLFLFSAYLFLNSSYAARLAARAAERTIGRTVEIKSLSAGLTSGVTLRGIGIGQGKRALSRIELLRIGFHPRGLLTGRALSLYITNPKIFYSALKAEGFGPGDKGPIGAGKARGGGGGNIEPPAIPWFIKDIVLRGLVLQNSPEDHSRDNPALIGPLHLTLRVKPGGKAVVSLKTYLPVLKTSASMNMELEGSELPLLQGDLKVGEIHLKDIGAGGVSIIGRGSVKTSLEVGQEKGAASAALTGKFKDISLEQFPAARPASGTLRALLTLKNDLSTAGLKAELFIKEPGIGKGELRVGHMKASYDIREKRLKITEAALTFPHPATGSIHVRGELLGVSDPDPMIDMELRAEKLPLTLFNETLLAPLSIKVTEKGRQKGLSGRAAISGRPAKGLSWDSELTLGEDISYKAYELRLKKNPLRISSRGTCFVEKGRVRIESLRAEAGRTGPITLRGSITGLTGVDPEIDLVLKGEDLDLGVLGKTLSAPGLRGIEVEGGLKAWLTLRGAAASPAINGKISVKGLSLKGHGLEMAEAEAQLGLGYDNGALRLTQITAAADSLGFRTEEGGQSRVQKVRLLVPALTYDKDFFRAKNLEIKIEKALLLAGKDPVFEEDNITIKGGLRGDLVKNRFIGEKFTFSAMAGHAITGEASDILLDLNSPVRASAVLDIRDLPLEKIAPPLLGFAGITSEIEASGTIDTELGVTVLEWSSITASVRLSLKGGAFSTDDGNVAAEGLRLLVAANLNMELPEKRVDFSMESEAVDFELLVNTFYGSFKDRPIKVKVQGEYDGSADTLSVPALKVIHSPVVSLEMPLVIHSLSTAPRLEAGPGTVEISNNDVFDLFIAPTYSEAMPILDGLDVFGNTVLNMRMEGTTEGFFVKGVLELREAGLVEKKGADAEAGAADVGGLRVSGVDLTLPIELAYPEAKKSKITDFGSLSIEDLTLGPLKISGFRARPAIGGNALVFADALEIPLFGGDLTLSDVVFADLLSPGRALGLQMSVSAVGLGEAGAALGLPPFEGTLSGEIPGIRLTGNHLSTEGEMRLSLFGGLVVIKEMSMENVFSPVTALKSSIDILDIDLGALTSAFEFGKITGVLQGRVKDLVIVQGQPESFFADIRTVKKRGVSQRISTKALENVSILGTGAAASVLNRGIYSLFNEYRYEKMGFQGQLKNDELLLLGIETQGDKGYIIKGALIPPRVDVVSYTERISFKEMMKRLEGVNFSSAESE